MSSTQHLLNRAFLLSGIRKNDDARKLLLAVLEKDPQNSRALLLYLDTFETREGRARGLDMLIQKLSQKSNPA